MKRLHALNDAGVSIWIDALLRELLDSADFARLIADHAVTGWVEELTAPDMVNTMSETTLQAFAHQDEVEHAVNVAGAAN